MSSKWKKYLCSALLGIAGTAFCASGTVLAASAEVIREDRPAISKQLDLPIYLWSDASKPTKGIIVGIHGLTFYAEAFDDFARHLASEGYPFYAADMRGFGRWKAEAAEYHGDSDIHFNQTKEDLLKLVDSIRRENPNTKIYCLGESLGANVAFWVASSKPDLIDGVITSGPCYRRWLHPRPRWFLSFAEGIWSPSKTKINLEPYINPYLSDDRTLTTSCLADPLICRRMSPVELIKTSFCNNETLRYVDHIPYEMPILIIAGEKDKVFKTKCIPEFASHIGSEKISLNVLKGKGHLLMEHQPLHPEIVGIVDKWLGVDSEKEEKLVDVPTISGN